MCFRLDKPEENQKIDSAIDKAARSSISKITFGDCSSLAYLMSRKKLEAKAKCSGVSVTWESYGALLVKK